MNHDRNYTGISRVPMSCTDPSAEPHLRIQAYDGLVGLAQPVEKNQVKTRYSSDGQKPHRDRPAAVERIVFCSKEAIEDSIHWT
jgi:hypothetical protein